MNGFTLLSETYQQLLQNGEIEREDAEKHIRIYDFLSSCDIEDLCIMVGSSVFNDIFRSLMKKSLENTNIDESIKEKIKNQLRWKFDEESVKEELHILGE